MAFPAPAATSTNNPEVTHLAEPQANPELVALVSKLRDAKAERDAAKDAKEWLVDEWRHLWPLAPEEITLRGCTEWDDCREVDMAGSPVIRPGEKYARRLRSIKDLGWFIDFRTSHIEKARSEKARLQRIAKLDEEKRVLRLGEEYYTAIERVKDASGIHAADARIKTAGRAVTHLCKQIMAVQAKSPACLAIKAEAVEVWCEVHTYLLKDDDGIFGWPCRLASDILNVAAGGVS
ncbi:hypothetical protein [Pseudaminobacter soli (ex Li et al. 2025)]|uniref:hypothetical protein n=1 Tax=Pseudaminobacter soli (ex Li et al. 2025) TaxID=1295366 RepID=UPI0011B25242|nr:hypothetical protein [Mesorhizobium soli]